MAIATGLAGILIGAGLAFALWRWSRRRVARPDASIAPASLQSVVASLPDGMPVFVSYSHEDLRDVDRLVKQIEQAGYGVWIDRRRTARSATPRPSCARSSPRNSSR
ncbi:MAG: toll/interleukin-1 receptor domain-containing protein [Methyloceanibacter sp.]